MYLSVHHSKQFDPDPIFVLRSGTDDITALKCARTSDDTEILISGSSIGVIKFWDFARKRPFLEFQSGSKSGILYVNLLKCTIDWYLITQNREGELLFWDANSLTSNMKVKNVWQISKVGFCSISLLEQNKANCLIAFSCGESSLSVRGFPSDSLSGTIKLIPDTKKGMVMQIKLFSSKNTEPFLLSGYEDGCLTIWNVLNGTALSSLKLYDDPIMALFVDTETFKVFTGSAGNLLKLVSINKENFELDTCNTVSTQYSGCSSAQVRRDSKLLFVGGWDGKIRVYTWRKMKLLAVLKYHTETINCMCFNDKNLIIVGCKDGKISIWDVYSEKI